MFEKYSKRPLAGNEPRSPPGMEHLGVLRRSRVVALGLLSVRKGLLVSLLLPLLPPGDSAVGGVSAILGTDAALGVVGPLGVWVAEARVGLSAWLVDVVA